MEAQGQRVRRYDAAALARGGARSGHLGSDGRVRLDAFTIDKLKQDGVDSAFFQRQLNQIMSRTYDRKYLELKGRMFVPANREIAAGMTTFSYAQYSMSGQAQVGGDLANDLPRSDVKVKEFTGTIKPITTSYVFTLDEILAAQAVNMPLEQRKANAARRAYEETLDNIIANGQGSATGPGTYGWYGLLNQVLFNSSTNTGGALSYTSHLTIGSGGSGPNATSWLGGAAGSGKTPDQILADMNGMVNYIVTQTGDVEHPDTLIMPVGQYTYIATTPWNDSNASNVTILEFFLRNQPYIKEVHSWTRTSGAGIPVAGSVNGVNGPTTSATGLSSGAVTDRAVAYKRDADHVSVVIPMDFTQQPVQWQSLAYKVPCFALCGGVVAQYPAAICYVDGI